MKNRLLTLLLLALTNLVLAQQIDFVVPRRSPVRLASHDKFLNASFKGVYTLTGTYRYGYQLKDGGGAYFDGSPELFFAPDPRVAATLPFWKPQGRVKELQFTNEKQFI